jgi:hypothetical protein
VRRTEHGWAITREENIIARPEESYVDSNGGYFFTVKPVNLEEDWEPSANVLRALHYRRALTLDNAVVMAVAVADDHLWGDLDDTEDPVVYTLTRLELESLFRLKEQDNGE